MRKKIGLYDFYGVGWGNISDIREEYTFSKICCYDPQPHVSQADLRTPRHIGRQ